MARLEILLPAMGEGIIEAGITKWLVNTGDHVEEDDSLLEVATDKVDSEIPAPEAGVIKELILKEGDIPKVGDLLLVMETQAEEQEAVSSPPEAPEQTDSMAEEKSSEQKEEISETESTGQADRETETDSSGQADRETRTISPVQTKNKTEAIISETLIENRTISGKFLSPLARKIAREEGIAAGILDKIRGSGINGRIGKADILPLIGKDISATGPATTTADTTAASISLAPGDEIIKMDRMRQLIANHMVHSKTTAPHVTSFIEADVTAMVNWRNRIKNDFLEKENQKLTFTPLFIEATARALRDYPMLNVSADGTNIIVRKRINIGMATALPSGNLIVPVIKDADTKSLLGLTKDVNDLAARARSNKLKPDEISGGTFTITNFGSFRNLSGTPIINQPEAAILGLGTIIKKPAVIETKMGDTIGIRQMIILSLSYDHRVVDGALGGMFLKRIADILEEFDVSRSI